MAFVITEACVDVLDKTCTKECPVDCIYEGERSLYINPDECIDCGACEPVCPSKAIFYEDDLPATQQRHLADNARFFAEPLPGRVVALGTPMSARSVGAGGRGHSARAVPAPSSNRLTQNPLTVLRPQHPRVVHHLLSSHIRHP